MFSLVLASTPLASSVYFLATESIASPVLTILSVESLNDCPRELSVVFPVVNSLNVSLIDF